MWGWLALRAAGVLPCFGVDDDGFAFGDEEGDVDHDAGFEFGLFGAAGGGVAFYAGVGFDDF